MTTRTRYFMLGAFGVLVAGLCAGVVAYYGGFPGVAAQAGPSELAYVPSNAAVVAYADVREVMSSELRSRLKEVMPAEDEAKGREEFKQRTGIDLETDIDHVVAAVIPRDETAPNDAGFIAFRGRFDAVRLESLAREHGGVVDQYHGKRLLKLAVGGDHESRPAQPGAAEGERAHPTGMPHSMVLAFVEPGLVMCGDEQSVHAAIDTAASGSSITGNPEVMHLIESVERGTNAWGIGRFDVLARRAQLPEGVTAQIPAIKWFSAAGRVNGGVAATLRAEARDDQAAQNLRDVVNGFMALARLQAGSRPEWQGVLQTVTLGGTGKTVELSFTLPSEVFDALIAHGRAMHKREAN